MEVDTETLVYVVVLVIVAVLFTGPGMWSEKWGWKLLDRFKRRRKD